MWSKFVQFLKTQPGVALWVAGALTSWLAAFGVGASPTVTATVSAVASGVITLIVAATVRPVAIPTITGAVTAIASALAAAGVIHATADQIGKSVIVLSIVLALLTHQAVKIQNLGRKLAQVPARL